MSAVLNDDVLRHICDLLPADALISASRTHPIFFDRHIKEKYRKVHFTRADQGSRCLWKHIQESGYAADAVKTVHIHPWLVKPQTQSYHSRTESALTSVAMLFDAEHTTKKLRKRFMQLLGQELEHTKALFASLTKVQEYRIEWDEDPAYPQELFNAFLQPLYAWRDTLTRLSIHIPVNMLNFFVTAKLPHLESVHVCLSSAKMPRENIDLHLDGFLVFLHNLKDTLISLSIQTSPHSEELELSRFFKYLGVFPHLRRVGLVIPFDGGQLPDPEPFCRWLKKHRRTVDELKLGTTRCAVAHARGGGAQECFNWIQAIVGSIQDPFPELKKVSLALRPLKASFEAVSDFLRLHASTLEELALTDRTLTYDDVCGHILPALSSTSTGVGGLKLLEMRLDALDQPQLLRSLAERLPVLRTLRLDLVDKGRMDGMIRSTRALTEFVGDVDSIFANAGREWALETLAITPGLNGLWIGVNRSALMGRIPSITTIKPLRINDP